MHVYWQYTLQKPIKAGVGGKLIQNVKEIEILETIFSADLAYASNTEKHI